MSCSMKGCSSCRRLNPAGVSFFTFPRGELQKLWLKACGKDEKSWTWSKNKVICSKHFRSEDFVRKGTKKYIKTDAVPIVETRPSGSGSFNQTMSTLSTTTIDTSSQINISASSTDSGEQRALKRKLSASNIPEEVPSFSSAGDHGKTKIVSGECLPKDDRIFDAIGATEELNSYIGLAREFGLEAEHDYCDKLKRIQTVLIDMSTLISKNGLSANKLISNIHIKELEDWINHYASKLPPVEHFIIPGGGTASASLQVARSICRRTERSVVPLVRLGDVDKDAQIYLNRLSDFLFTVSRIAAKYDKRTESIYIPKPEEIEKK